MLIATPQLKSSVRLLSSGKSVLSKIRESSSYFTDNCGDPNISLHHRCPCLVVEGLEYNLFAGDGANCIDTLDGTSSVNGRGGNSNHRHTRELTARERIGGSTHHEHYCNCRTPVFVLRARRMVPEEAV